MDPITAALIVGGGAQALSAVAQYYQSEKARKASGERLKQIEELFNSIKPPGYDVTPLSPPELITQMIPQPAFDMAGITPDKYEAVGKYLPEVAKFVAERNPELAQFSQEGRQGRDAQIQALNDIKMRTGQLSDAEAQDASMSAMRDAQIGAQSRSESILQDANRRGQLGSGTALAAQLQSSGDQMGRSANLSSNAYLEALKNKLGALRDSGTMGRQLAQDDLGQQNSNAAIINSYNQRASRDMNAFNQNAAEVRNRGQLVNFETAQDAANRNVIASNQAKYSNQQRTDNILNDAYNRNFNERNFQNNTATNQYNLRAGEIGRQNDIKGQTFKDAMSQASAKAGVGYNAINMNNQFTSDRNQAIQGLGNAASQGAMYYGTRSSAKPTVTPDQGQFEQGSTPNMSSASLYREPNSYAYEPVQNSDESFSDYQRRMGRKF
jgi:hypothetical protein